jgi:hypothetical protein
MVLELAAATAPETFEAWIAVRMFGRFPETRSVCWSDLWSPRMDGCGMKAILREMISVRSCWSETALYETNLSTSNLNRRCL